MREDGKKKPSKKVVKLFKRNWIFPAVYVITAAILLSGVFAYQYFMNDSATKPVSKTPIVQTGSNKPANPATKTIETVKSPFMNEKNVDVIKGFYDSKASSEEQEKALVYYNGTYYKNTGVNYKSKDGKAVDVVASLSGKVTNVQDDQMLGVVITLTHDNGIETMYQGLSKSAVEKGDTVVQGEVIGQTGISELTKDEGMGMHFEIRKDNVAVNPTSILNKNISAVDEYVKTMNEAASGKADSNTNNDKDSTDDSKTTDPKEDNTK